jgi:hypothetical protein
MPYDTQDDHDLAQPVELPEGGAPTGPQYPRAPHRQSGKKRLVIVLLVVVLVGAAGGAGWMVWKKRSSHTSDKPNTSQTAQTSPTPSGDVPDSTELKTYKSEDLMLQLSYPSTWQAVETNGGITLTSPSISYQTTDKGEVPGVFRVYIRQGARDVDGKYIGAGVAVGPSEKLVYASPGSTQRKDTNLTRFGAGDSSHFTFFMVSGDYNLKKDDQLGAKYGREAETYIIAGGYGTKDQKDDLNFANVPLDKYQSKAYTQALNIVKSLKL